MTRRHVLAVTLALLALAAPPALARADFGLVPGSATMTTEYRDGTIDTQAGSHPYGFTVHFELKTDGSGKTEGGKLRDVLSDLPPGFFANPTTVPACPRQKFEGPLPSCAPSTQVGVMHVILPEVKGEGVGPLYNLEPPPGVAAQFGFTAVGFTALLSASIDPEKGYSAHVEAPNLPLEASSVGVAIWTMASATSTYSTVVIAMLRNNARGISREG